MNVVYGSEPLGLRYVRGRKLDRPVAYVFCHEKTVSYLKSICLTMVQQFPSAVGTHPVRQEILCFYVTRSCTAKPEFNPRVQILAKFHIIYYFQGLVAVLRISYFITQHEMRLPVFFTHERRV